MKQSQFCQIMGTLWLIILFVSSESTSLFNIIFKILSGILIIGYFVLGFLYDAKEKKEYNNNQEINKQ